MKKLFISIFIFCFVHANFAQLLANGDFLFGSTGWSCNPEISGETSYGGSNPLNNVAEIDAGASLCQTVIGLTAGQLYALSFVASRRTGSCPAPAVTNVNISISGGVLAGVVTRTNITFGYTTSGFLFTPTSSSHTLTFSAGSGFGASTCGLIIDNIAISLSALPIELMNFDGTADENEINLSWSTASEENCHHFEIEKSENGADFKSVAYIPANNDNGNNGIKLNYAFTDTAPATPINYYRLKQTDKDNSYSYSKIIYVLFQRQMPHEITLLPNPNHGNFKLYFSSGSRNLARVKVLNSLGKSVYEQSYENLKDEVSIQLPDVLPGYYHCVVTTSSGNQHFPLIVE